MIVSALLARYVLVSTPLQVTPHSGRGPANDRVGGCGGASAAQRSDTDRDAESGTVEQVGGDEPGLPSGSVTGGGASRPRRGIATP